MSAARADSPTPPPARTDDKRSKRKSTATSAPPTRGARAVDVGKQVLAVLLFLGLLGAATYGTHRAATTSQRFALRKVELTGTRRIQTKDVLARAGIALGDNIFRVDPREVRRRLLEDPWVRDARVSRELLDTLRVELDENQAMAVAIVAGERWLATRTGQLFKRAQPGDPTDLPVVTGVDPAHVARAKGRELSQLVSASEVLRDYERVPMSKVFAPEEVHVGPDGAVVLTVGEEGVTLHLGRGPFRKKLLMAQKVVSLVQRKGQKPGIVFLDNAAHEERVVVRMR